MVKRHFISDEDTSASITVEKVSETIFQITTYCNGEVTEWVQLGLSDLIELIKDLEDIKKTLQPF